MLDIDGDAADALVAQAATLLEIDLSDEMFRESEDRFYVPPADETAARSSTAGIGVPANDEASVAENSDSNSITSEETADSFSNQPVTLTLLGNGSTLRDRDRVVEFRYSPSGEKVSAEAERREQNPGTKYEKLAQRFEWEQGRVALNVASLQGKRGPGCDLLSFASEEDRQLFIEAHSEGIGDTSLVHRFIEVKGGGDGTVELTDNEWEAAQEFGERYYVYHIQRSDKKHCRVTTLADPYHSDAKVIRYKLDVSADPSSELWSMDIDSAAELD
jgi:hypothetical protein